MCSSISTNNEMQFLFCKLMSKNYHFDVEKKRKKKPRHSSHRGGHTVVGAGKLASCIGLGNFLNLIEHEIFV